MKIAMIFPGYTSQFVGMGKELYDQHRIVQEYFEEASSVLSHNFVKLCFASSDTELSKIINAYPAIFLISCAIVALLKEEGVEPSLVAGYNLGEYSALFGSQSITFPDGLYFLHKYATFYQDLLDVHSFSMFRISGLTSQEVEEACVKAELWSQDSIEISVFEADSVHMISGLHKTVEYARTLLEQQGGVTIDQIPVEFGLHSSHMNHIAHHLNLYLEKIDCKNLVVPLCESLNGRLIQDAQEARALLTERINNPIMLERILHFVSRYDLIVEVGPGNHLQNLMRKYFPQCKVVSVNKQSDLVELLSIVNEYKKNELVELPTNLESEKVNE